MVAVARERKIDPVYGKRLRHLRESKGLSQSKLGELAGMKYQAIARLEKGERLPNWDTFLRLADALDVSLDEFRDTTDDPPTSAPPALVTDPDGDVPDTPPPSRFTGKRK